MHIGFDGMPLSQPLAGVGHYTLELARTLAGLCPGDEVEIVSPRPYTFVPPSGENSDGWPPNLALVRAPATLLSRRWWTIGLPRYLARSPIVLFHGTNFEIPLWVKQKRATVLTVHDLSQILHPDTHEVRSARRAQRRLPRMTRAATMIITPTEAVRRELCAQLKVVPEKVIAVPEAARSPFRPMPPEQTEETRKRLGIGHDFLLFVGTIEPRKDLPTLVRAFEQVAQTHGPDLQLVITGRRGWLVDDLLARIGSSAAADRIVLTGYLSDEEIRGLYSTCRAFVYPSIYEGFGLPPLEAMACGAPVIASRVPSIVEVCGEGALLLEPQSTSVLAEAITHLLEDKDARRRLSSAGLQRAAEFSWERTARTTREVYEEALKRFEREKK